MYTLSHRVNEPPTRVIDGVTLHPHDHRLQLITAASPGVRQIDVSQEHQQNLPCLTAHAHCSHLIRSRGLSQLDAPFPGSHLPMRRVLVDRHDNEWNLRFNLF